MNKQSFFSVLDMASGERGILVGFQGFPMFIERLIDMGFHENVEVESLGRLPFSGPIILRCDQTLLALREEEALCLKIKKISLTPPVSV